MRSTSASRPTATQPKVAPQLDGEYRLLLDDDAIRRLPDGEINTDNHPIIELRNARNIILKGQTENEAG